MRLEDEIKQKKFASELHKLTINLIYTSNWITQFVEKLFKEKGITGQQFNILRILRGQHPKPASVNLVRERMLDKMSDVSRLVERLRVKGLVSRKECESDRRMADVLITKKGLDLLADFDKMQKKMDDPLSNLSEKEAKIVNDLLDKLRG